MWHSCNAISLLVQELAGIKPASTTAVAPNTTSSTAASHQSIVTENTNDSVQGNLLCIVVQ